MRKGVLKVSNGSRNIFLVVVSVMFCAVTAGSFGIVRIEQDASVAATLVTIMFGALATTIGVLATVLKVEGVKNQVADIKADTHSLLNGAMDAKLSAAVRRELVALLDEHLEKTKPD